MGTRTLITIGTDGFRDYVDLPDGRTINLGTVSILKLVTELVGSPVLARKALDTFLKDGTATIAVEMPSLIDLLKPKRSRWAVHENRLIQPDSRTFPRGAGAMNADELKTQIGLVEAQVEKLATLSGAEQASAVSNVRQLVAALVADAEVSPATVRDPFLFKLAALEALVAQDKAPSGEQLASLAKGLLLTPKTASEKTALAIDEDAKIELELYMDNETRLTNQKKGILQNILRKMKAGKYDHNQAWKLWMFWVDEGAKMYAREFKVGKDFFPKELRESLAKDIANAEKRLIEDGEYSHIKVAEDGGILDILDAPAPAPESVVAPVVTAAEETPSKAAAEVLNLAEGEVQVVNEALAQSVMAKVETALKSVEASTKVNTHLAKNDLHTISSRLASMLQEANLADPALRPQLTDLGNKADKIQTHFSI